MLHKIDTNYINCSFLHLIKNCLWFCDYVTYYESKSLSDKVFISIKSKCNKWLVELVIIVCLLWGFGKGKIVGAPTTTAEIRTYFELRSRVWTMDLKHNILSHVGGGSDKALLCAVDFASLGEGKSGGSQSTLMKLMGMDISLSEAQKDQQQQQLILTAVKTEPRVQSPCDNATPAASSQNSGGLFSGIMSATTNNKRMRTDDRPLSSSPEMPVLAMPLPSLTPSPGPQGHSSPMSSGSYDPYSPKGKLGQEDQSPPGSPNGYSVDSGDAKKKKSSAPCQQEELCLVCGDRASGYHYNALTCEGCKGFFRRSITKNAVYQCKYGNDCEIDMYMRRKCQECRLKKCLHVGMRPECVVPEYQCIEKRKEKKAQKDKDNPNSTIDSPEVILVKESETKVESEKLLAPSKVKPVSPEQEELIHRLVYFQNEYEQPSEEDLKRITNQPSDGEDQSDLRFRHITEITILTVQLIVEFAKRLPGFDKLLREDQIALLKACSSEVMMLRMARRYDVNSDSILFANNQPYTKDSYSIAGMGETIEDMLRFCRQIYAMKVDNAEYALLTAIVIFSERPSLIESWKVEKIQEIYLEALRAYVDNRRKPKSGMIFAKLLSVLTELRTLGNQNSEMCFSLKLKNKKLPPFLAEIWDVIP